MIEYLAHIVSVLITAVAIIILVLLLNRYERKRTEKYHITCEYKMLTYSYNKCNEALDMLNELGKDGWEICSTYNDGYSITSVILKRETLHTS